MKRRILTLLLALMALGTARLYAAEPYAVYWEDYSSGTRVFKLTFYYDDNRSQHQAVNTEIDFSMNTGSNEPEWIKNRYGYNPWDVKEVIFDASFANYRPTTTSHWFDHMYGVKTITNIQNLNTSQVTDMSYMFFCSRVTSLDLSTFDVSNVTDMSDMFHGCDATSIKLDNWNLSKIVSMKRMFENGKITSLSLNLNTENVTDMSDMFHGCENLQTITFGSLWNTANVTDMSDMFQGCGKLQTISFASNWNTANVTDMSYMFADCPELLSLNLNSWNVGKVTKMNNMFNNCESLYNLNVSNWNTASVTTTSEMFSGCSSLQTISVSGWNTANVTSMTGMFRNCDKLQTIYFGSNWSTGNVTNMNSMFAKCSSLSTLNLSGWNPSSVTTMKNMFNGCSALSTLTFGNSWNTSSVTTMENMFNGCSGLTTLDLHSWSTDSLATMKGMFAGCTNLATLNLSGWNNPELTDIAEMFKDCTALTTLNLSGWQVPKLTSVANWFDGCSALANLNLTNFDGPAINTVKELFSGCTSLSYIDLSSFHVPNVTNMSGMFYDCHNLSDLNVSGWNTSNVTNMDWLFFGCRALASLDLSSWNTSNVLTISCMFLDCSSLRSLDLSSFDTGKIYNMNRAFDGCKVLSSLNLSGWNTSSVSKMAGMFRDCYMLPEIDLSSFDTGKVSDMDRMFSDCKNLTTIYVGEKWNTTSVTSSYKMFDGCTKLVGGMGTVYNPLNLEKGYARIDRGYGERGYLSSMPYVIYANGTLTFYCDGNRDAHADETIYYLNSDIEPPTWLEKKDNITTVVFDPSFAYTRPTSANSWFGEMANLTNITGLEYLHTDYVTTMIFMFYHCTSLRSLDLSHFNTANVTNMQSMFDLCSELTELDLSSFNTAKVTNMNDMFYYCNNLTTISVGPGWNTDAVENSAYMFENCAALKGSNGTAYQSSNPKDKTYAHIDTSDYPGYFCDQTLKGVYVSFVPETGTLTFRNDTRRASFGENTFDLNADGETPGWYANRKAITNVVFDFMFGDVHPTTAYSWFRGMSNLTDISGIENLCTDSITNMESMFAGCSKLTDLNLSAFNTASVVNMENMFNGCSRLTTIHVGTGWNTAGVANSIDMFDGCTQLVGGNGTTYDENHTDKEYACLNGGTSVPSYLTDNLAKEPYVVFADGTLTFCYDGLKTLRTNAYDLNTGNEAPAWLSHNADVTAVEFDPSFAEARPTSTYGWFDSMNRLADISGLQYLNTSEVTNMASMFQACTGLATLDLGSFNTANVTDMSAMFSGCSALTTIYVGTGWSTASVTQSDGMFVGCTQLAGSAGTQFSPDATGAERAAVDGIGDATGYLSYLAYATITHAYGSDGTTYNYLSFFYDGMHAEHALSEPVFRLNSGTEEPAWATRAAEFDGVTFGSSFAGVRPTTAYHWFKGMTKMQSFSSRFFNTSEVTTMNGMFEGCTALETFVADGWDTGKVTSMSNMFKDCSSLASAELNTFNTAHVTDMSGMFQNCAALTTLNLEAFVTAGVTNMSNMFNGCSSLTSISVADGWNTSHVTNSSGMFQNCTSIRGSEGTTYSASYTDSARARVDGGTSSPGYLSYLVAAPYASWDSATETLTFYCDRWRSTHSETFPLGDYPGWSSKSLKHVVFDPSFDTARPTNTYHWFYGNIYLEDITGIEYLHTDNVTSMVNMFWKCQKLKDLDVSHFNTSNVTSMSGMFMYCSALTTLDLSGWDTGNVTDMREMFRESTNLSSIYAGEGWNTDGVTSSTQMFYGCTSLRGGSYTYYNNTNPDDKTYARIDGGTSYPGYLSNKPKAYAVFNEEDATLSIYNNNSYGNFDDSVIIFEYSASGETAPGWAARSADIRNVEVRTSFSSGITITSTRMWFAGMSNLEEVRYLNNLNTENITDMSGMFSGCSKLPALDFSDWSPKNVTDMSHMFEGCAHLSALDLSAFDTGKVTDMNSMFAGCTALTRLDLSSFSAEQVTDMGSMFLGDRNLQTIFVRLDWNAASLLPSKAANMFLGCTSLTGENGTGYDPAHTDNAYARLDRPADGAPGYFSAKLEAYAHMTDPSATTLTFYYDTQRSLREGITFGLEPGWDESVLEWGDYSNIEHVVFDSSFDGARPATTAYWFSEKQNLKDVTGMEYLHTDSVTRMDRMFYNCSKLTQLDLSAWNTQQLTSAWQMFRGCTGLTELNLSGWNTERLTTVSGMFQGCSNLETIYASDWNKEATDYRSTFTGCTKLTGGAGTTYAGYESSETTYDHLDGGTENPGFFTDPAQREAYACYSEADSTLTFCYDVKKTARQNEGKTIYANVLNTGSNPQWKTIGEGIAHVAFNSAFADVRPKSTREWFSTMKNLTDISGLSYLRTDEVSDMYAMFNGCSRLTSLDLSHFNTSKVTGMTNMFRNCTALKALDVSGWNTGNVTYMNFMFYHCDSLTLIDVSHFNTDKVIGMNSMFYYCQSLKALDVSGWNTSKVTDMNAMFNACNALTKLDVSSWNTANVTNMYAMFCGCHALTELDVSGWNTDKVTNMQAMFSGCNVVTSLDVSGWNTSKVTNMQAMFANCKALTTLDVSGWNTGKVTSFGSMFSGCGALTELDLSSFDTSNATNISGMFSDCSELTSVDVSGFDTSKATSLGSMFFGCKKLTELDLSSWNTANVTSFYYTFYQCYALKTIYVGNGWNTDAATESRFMFTSCTSLVGGNGTAYSSSHTDKEYARIDASDSPGYLTLGIREAYAVLSTDGTTLTFYYDVKKTQREGTTYDVPWTGTYPGWSDWNTGNETVTTVTFDKSFNGYHGMTKTSFMFVNMKNLTTINNLQYLHTENVTTMSNMFALCGKLTNIDVTHFDTQNVTDIGSMFRNCILLTHIDVSHFNTSKVTGMGMMFYMCKALTSLDLRNFDTSKVTSLFSTFGECESLTELHLPNCSTPSLRDTHGTFSNCKRLTRLDISNLNTSNVTRMSNMFSGCSALTSLDVSHFDTKNVTEMSSMFSGCKVNSLDVSGFNTEKVTKMAGMFHGCSELTTLDVSNFDTHKVENMNSMFNDCNKLKSIDLSNFNTSNVTASAYMFYYCRQLTSLDLSSFNTSKVTNMDCMFNNCSNLSSIYVSDDWSTNAVTTSANMFLNCTSLKGGNGTTYVSSNPTDMTYAHVDTADNPGYFTYKATFQVGDVNKDGAITIADVTALVNIILGKTTDYDLRLADVTGEGQLTIADVKQLVSTVLGK